MNDDPKEAAAGPGQTEPLILNANTDSPGGDLIREIRNLVNEQSRPQIVGATDPLSGATALVVLTRDGDGNETFEALPAHVFDDYLDEPRRRRGTARLTSLDSFIDVTNRFRDEESAVFACDDRTKPSLTAVFDYNPRNAPDGGEGIGVATPRFGQHRATFAFPLSDEWQAWNAANAKKMSVADFAAFLEDRIADIADPGDVELSDAQAAFINRLGGRDRIATVSDLVTLSKGLRVHENSQFAQSATLSSGEGELIARTEHTDANGVPLMIPNSFLIAIPVFRNDAPYAVLSRLRYRVNGGAMTLWFELWGTDKVFDHAFTEAADKVAAETSLPIYLGSPEA